MRILQGRGWTGPARIYRSAGSVRRHTGLLPARRPGTGIMTSDFTDAKRLYEILAEGKSRMQAQMTSGGHSVAAGRALSYGSIPGAVSEEISGIPFYRLITDLEAHFDEKKEELVEILQTLVNIP